MSNPSTLGPWLRRFLAEYIVTERNLARNTQKSYRDTFALLLPFVRAKTRKPVERLAVHDLTARRVRQFLDHIENDRGCSAQTRNQRLSAIRSFARFVASRDPGHLEWSASIRAIASKKATPQPIGWLSKTEMKTLLEVPNRRTPRGRIEHSCKDGQPSMPSSSASSEDPIRGLGSIGSSSAVPPACRRSPHGGSHLTRSATRVPATFSRPEST